MNQAHFDTLCARPPDDANIDTGSDLFGARIADRSEHRGQEAIAAQSEHRGQVAELDSDAEIQELLRIYIARKTSLTDQNFRLSIQPKVLDMKMPPPMKYSRTKKLQ
jgi:hypothetical protein